MFALKGAKSLVPQVLFLDLPHPLTLLNLSARDDALPTLGAFELLKVQISYKSLLDWTVPPRVAFGADFSLKRSAAQVIERSMSQVRLDKLGKNS